MGEEERPEQAVRLTLEPLGPLPPVRAVYDQSQHDEYHRQQRKHEARFTEQKERISKDDARALVGLWLDLDPSWRNPEIAHNQNVWMWAAVFLRGQDNTPHKDIEFTIEGSRTNPVYWDALAWTFARTEGERPLGQALHRWVGDVIRGKCPRPKGGKGSRGPAAKMDKRNDVIRWAVHLLTECGMPATRNEITERASACDIVAQVLDERGHPVRTYNSVLAIWQGKR